MCSEGRGFAFWYEGCVPTLGMGTFLGQREHVLAWLERWQLHVILAEKGGQLARVVLMIR